MPESKYQERDDLYEWLVDENSRDQFAIRQGKALRYFGFKGQQHNLLKSHTTGLESGLKTRRGVSGKSLGLQMAHTSLLFTLKVLFSGGDSFEKVNRFVHTEVMEVQFSPNEQYLMTWNGNKNKSEKSICLWDRRNGKKLKEFKYDIEVHGVWPCFSWSHDDKYFARKGQDLIMIYESETCSLLRDEGGTKRP